MSHVQGERTWTVKEIMAWSVGFLRDQACASPRVDVELLLARALRCSRIDLYTGIEKPLDSNERRIFRDFLKRRAAGEPIAYIVGERDFFGLRFEVDRRVLIPRPETELLVQMVLDDVKKRNKPSSDVLDVGTGSGCIAVALKKALPDGSYVEAWDLSPEALSVAAANAKAHTAEVSFRECNALSPVPWSDGKKFDYIVSNPPYIAVGDPSLDAQVAKFEPHLALFARESGTDFYTRIAEYAAQRLKSEGALILEIGATLAKPVAEILAKASWTNIVTIKDYSGHDRMISALYKA